MYELQWTVKNATQWFTVQTGSEAMLKKLMTIKQKDFPKFLYRIVRKE